MNIERKGKVFSVELSEVDERNLEVVMHYLEDKKGITCKRGAAIRMIIAERYEEIVKEADACGKSLDDFLNNR